MQGISKLTRFQHLEIVAQPTSVVEGSSSGESMMARPAERHCVCHDTCAGLLAVHCHACVQEDANKSKTIELDDSDQDTPILQLV